MAQTAPPEESTDTAANAERMLEAEFGDQIHLERAREKLPTLLAAEEKLLAAEQASLRLGRVGILAVTDRRLIHIYFGHFLRRLKITEIDYGNVESVHADSWRTFSRVVVRLKKRQRTVFLPTLNVNFPLPIVEDAGERVEGLATCIRNAVRRVQEPVKTGSPPLKTVG